ncbi:MAG TPA: hypothetical protein VGB76_13005 [Pyrinomonadaceae bacterium]
MNCQQFTSFIVEVARGQMMDAASRDGAVRHAESCQACAARLAQEQSLTGALRAVAQDIEDLSAPARVEAKLLAAFHESLPQRHAPATATVASTPAPVSQLTRDARTTPDASRFSRRSVFNATAAIAASLVLVVLATLYLRFTQTAPPTPQPLATNRQTVAGKASPPDRELTLAASPSPAPSSAPSIEAKPTPERAMPDAFKGVQSPRTNVKVASRQRRVPTMIKAQHVIDGGHAIIEPGVEGEMALNGAAKPGEAESVTDFISLVADAPAAPPLESGQLVRVQVPRAALASLGLPLNAERGNEPVKADVLLGGDGLARAIRFER